MSDTSVLWAGASDDEGDDADDTEAHGAVDETFAARRLRRWLSGMFGGRPESSDEPDDREET
jgi:hypothetical protein